MPKLFKSLWLVLLLPLMAQAAQDKYREGEHYRELRSPVQTATGQDQVEVSEVFWYGCPHCYTLEPIVDRWKPSLKDDVKFVYVPAFFGPNIWKTHAQFHHTAASLVKDKGEFSKIHDKIFSQIQDRNNRLVKEEDMAEFLQKEAGVDPKKFASVYKSFGVNNLMNQTYSKVRGYELTGVPALIVDGRYVVEPKVGLDNMPVVADFLIQKVRDERAAKAKQKAAPAKS